MAKLRKKAKRRILLVFALVFLLLGFFGIKYLINDNPETPNNNILNPSEPEDPIKTYSAKLIATGDGLVHSTVYNAAYQSSTSTYDFSDMLTYTKEKLKEYDIKYYKQ